MFVNLNISIELKGDINLTELAKKIEEMELGKMVLKTILERRQEELVNELCGPKHSRGYAFTRNGSKKRSVNTKLGSIGLRVNRVKNEKTGNTFKPLLQLLGLNGKEHYTKDVKMDCADTATKLSYRDSVEEARKRGLRVSKSTIHAFVQEIGPVMRSEREKRLRGKHDVVLADGTKAHALKKGEKNEINAAIGRDMETGEKTLLGVTVNKSWHETSEKANKHISENAVLVADAEKEIRRALKNQNFQLDIRHAIGEISYKLWQHEAPKEDKDAILTRLKEILYTLRNSVRKHTEDEDMKRLEWRTITTLDCLKKLAYDSEKEGYWRVGKFIRRSANHMVTFAKLLIAGKEIPYTSNMIERLMGEIAKRVKNKWAHWSEKGLENLLNIQLTRYCNREMYRKIWNKYVYGTIRNISMKTQLTTQGGNSNLF